jgi:hypothetical protein
MVNGNNPAQWQLNQPWQDNLGALFTSGGQNETIYSTSTIDVSQSGTTTISYRALASSVLGQTRRSTHDRLHRHRSAGAQDRNVNMLPGHCSANDGKEAPYFFDLFAVKTRNDVAYLDARALCRTVWCYVHDQGPGVGCGVKAIRHLLDYVLHLYSEPTSTVFWERSSPETPGRTCLRDRPSVRRRHILEVFREERLFRSIPARFCAISDISLPRADTVIAFVRWLTRGVIYCAIDCLPILRRLPQQSNSKVDASEEYDRCCDWERKPIDTSAEPLPCLRIDGCLRHKPGRRVASK